MSYTDEDRKADLEEHRKLYPEQYTHPICGKKVRVGTHLEFVVGRVVGSGFGLLAIPEEDSRTSYLVSHCIILEEE